MIIAFFENAKEKFNNKFNYIENTYISYKKPTKIICPIHGLFIQTPQSHMNSVHGCPKCAKDSKVTLNINSFIKRANNIHNNKYNYTKSVYIDRNTYLIVICLKHGDFKTTPDNHLNINKYGCPKCGKEKMILSQRLTTKKYIEQAINIHGSYYDYSKTIYTGAHNKIIVICPEHGKWQPTASNHKNNKSGCPQCAFIKRSNSKYETYVEEYLINNNIKYQREQSFINLVNTKTDCYLRFDFWLPELNTIIEYDGEHHFKPVKYGNKDPIKLLEYTKYKDNIKNIYCNDNNIKLIRIPYTTKTKNSINKVLLKLI